MTEFFKKLKSALLSAKDFFKKIPFAEIIKNIGKAMAEIWQKVKVYLKTSPTFTPPSKEKVFSFVLNWWHWLLGGIFAFLVLYYPTGAVLIHQIDDNPDFADKYEKTETPKEISTLYALIDREINKHVWTPNLPFFFPSAVLDNMPAFQLGVMNAAYKIATAVAEENPDARELKNAADLLGYPGTTWYVADWKPAVSANSKYQKALNELKNYETALRNGAEFNTSPQALAALLKAQANILKECAEKIKKQVAKYEKRPLDFRADNVFYRVKGSAYTVYLSLRDVEEDFSAPFENEDIRKLWIDAEDSLKRALNIRPFFVVNGGPETQFLPNHLLNVGFYISAAEADLRRIIYKINKPELKHEVP